VTTVVVGFCPWSGGNSQGITFVSDCRLSNQWPSGLITVGRDDGQKLFRMGQFAIAAYSGARIPALFALRRLEAKIPRLQRLSDSASLKDHLERTLTKGANEAKATSRGRTGSFSVFLAYQTASGRFDLLLYTYPPKEKTLIAAFPIGILNERPPIFMMGTGVEARVEYQETLLRILCELVGQNVWVDVPVFHRESTVLALALLDLLEQGKLPHSGGGIQAISLTSAGAQAWEVRSSSAEYLHDRSADPDWQRHGPAQLKA
jgi:hypothetical protein